MLFIALIDGVISLSLLNFIAKNKTTKTTAKILIVIKNINAFNLIDIK